MCRPRREFRAESFALEGRLLLAILPHLHVRPTVGFEGIIIPGTKKVSQVVMQQDGEATVSLSGSIPPGTGPLQVVVATDPSSPAVGVNVGAVDQTVTLTNGASQATVTVPILAGAPNPGEVDVDLTITPINPPPDLRTSGPLELRILASNATIPTKTVSVSATTPEPNPAPPPDATIPTKTVSVSATTPQPNPAPPPDAMIPPKIVSVQGEPQGIVLTFSKPMDPVGASNVNNYFVRATKASTKTNSFGPIDNLTLPLHMGSPFSPSTHTVTQSVPLQAAEYDPATNSVTLVPKRKLTYSANIIVTQGHQTKVSGRPGHQSNPGPGLTDVEGNLINGDTTPGKFGISVVRGTQKLSGVATIYGGG
jgi:hypothetical protein